MTIQKNHETAIESLVLYDPNKIYGYELALEYEFPSGMPVVITPFHKIAGESNKQIAYAQKPGLYYGFVVEVNGKALYTVYQNREHASLLSSGYEEEILLTLGNDLAIPRWQLCEIYDMIEKYRKSNEELAEDKRQRLRELMLEDAQEENLSVAS